MIDALGELAEGEHRRHFIPWKYVRDMTQQAVTDANWKRIATRLGYDPEDFQNAEQFRRKWQRDLFNELNNIWKGSGSENIASGADIDWRVWEEVRARVLRYAGKD